MNPPDEPHPKEPFTDYFPAKHSEDEKDSRLHHLAFVPNGDQMAVLVEKIRTVSDISNDTRSSGMKPDLRSFFDVLQSTSLSKHERLVAFMNMLKTENSIVQFLSLLEGAHLEEFLLLLEEHDGYPTLVRQIEACSTWPCFKGMLERHQYEPSKDRNPCLDTAFGARSLQLSPMMEECTPSTPTSRTAMRSSLAASDIHTPLVFSPHTAPSFQMDLRSPSLTPLDDEKTPRSNVAACGSKAASGLTTPRSFFTPPTRSPSSQQVVAIDVDTPLNSPNDLNGLACNIEAKPVEFGAMHWGRQISASPVDSRISAVDSHVALHGSHTQDSLDEASADSGLLTPGRSLYRSRSRSPESACAEHGSRAASTVITPVRPTPPKNWCASGSDRTACSVCAVHGSRAASTVNTPRLGHLRESPRSRALSLLSELPGTLRSGESAPSQCAVRGSRPTSARTPSSDDMILSHADIRTPNRSPLPSRPVSCGSCAAAHGSRAESGTHTPNRQPICAGAPQFAPGNLPMLRLDAAYVEGGDGESHTSGRSPVARSPFSDGAIRGSPAASSTCTPRDFAMPLVADIFCPWQTPPGRNASPGSHRATLGSRPASGTYTPELFIDTPGIYALSPRSTDAMKGSVILSGIFTPRPESPMCEDILGPLKLNVCLSPRSDFAIAFSRAASGLYTPNNISHSDSDTHSITSHDAIRYSRPSSCVLSPSERSFPHSRGVRRSHLQSGLASLAGEYSLDVCTGAAYGASRRTFSVPVSRERQDGTKKEHNIRAYVRIAGKKRRSRSLPKLYSVYMASCLPNPREEPEFWPSFGKHENHWGPVLPTV